MQRDCPDKVAPKEETETPVKGRLRRAHLIDKASVYVKTKLSGAEVPCLMETGCEITMAPRRLVQRHRIQISPTERQIWAANGSAIELSGEAIVPFVLNDGSIDTFALVSPDVEEVMIGSDWLEKRKCIWDFGGGQLLSLIHI